MAILEFHTVHFMVSWMVGKRLFAQGNPITLVIKVKKRCFNHAIELSQKPAAIEIRSKERLFIQL